MNLGKMVRFGTVWYGANLWLNVILYNQQKV